jgi:hypothetical protein
MFLHGEIFEFPYILLLPENTFECKWQGHSETHPLFLCWLSLRKYFIIYLFISDLASSENHQKDLTLIGNRLLSRNPW